MKSPVALHWLSRSTTRTLFPIRPRAWARLQATVVLPTPPLLLTIATMTPMIPSIDPLGRGDPPGANLACQLWRPDPDQLANFINKIITKVK